MKLLKIEHLGKKARMDRRKIRIYNTNRFLVKHTETMNSEDDMDMPMSGDGEMSGDEHDVEPRNADARSADKKQKREKPLKIRGSLDDVLRAAVRGGEMS